MPTKNAIDRKDIFGGIVYVTIFRREFYFRIQYLIRPSSCPFTSTIFSTTISLSVFDEYLEKKTEKSL